MKVESVFSMYFKVIFSALLVSGTLVLDSAGAKSSKCVARKDPLSITVDREFQTVDLEAKGTVHPIICTTNKPANLSLWFNGKYAYRTRSERLLESSTGVKIITSPCRLVVNFTSKLVECHLGTYECRATNATGSRVTALSNVTYLTTNRRPEKFRFQIEDPMLRKKKELIIGTSANLSCTYRGEHWHSTSPYKAYFEHMEGKFVELKETEKGPKKVRIFQTESTGGVNEKEGTFKIGLYRINHTHSLTYRCSIMLADSSSTCPRFDASKWISRTLTISFRPCRAGYYCSNISSVETPCPGGTYSGVMGLFDRTKCHQCPIDSYCPKASTAPIKCKKTKFLPYDWKEHPLTPAKSNDDCDRCPVEPCDMNSKNKRTCTFICGQREEVQTDEGTPISLVCRLSDASLLTNLTWMKGNHTVFTSDSNVLSNSSGKLFHLSIAKTRLEDSGEYICSGYEKVLGTNVRAIIRLKVVRRDERSNSLELALGIAGAVVPVLIMALCFVCYRKRRHNSLHSSAHNSDFTASTGIYTETHLPEPLRQLFQRLPSQGSEVEHAFDVFICYSSSDKEWVRRTLLEKLKEYNMRVCIDFKDFTPGDFIIQNIADAIYNSRKTIAVLSPDFVVSAWCQQELQMALSRIEDKHQVIPLMYRDCEVPPFLWHRTYLDWCNPDIRPIFWQQLLRAVNDGRDVNLPIEDGTVNLGSDVDSLLEEEVGGTRVSAIESFDGII